MSHIFIRENGVITATDDIKETEFRSLFSRNYGVISTSKARGKTWAKPSFYIYQSETLSGTK